MTKRELLLGGLLAAMSAWGCGVSVPDTSFPQSAEVEGSGVSNGLQTKTISCTNTVVTLDRDLSGTGGPSIKVTDGSGNVAYSGADAVTGNINDSQQLNGANGTWTLAVDGNGFSGSMKITLHCP